MSAEMVFYELGKQQGSKEATIEVDNSTFSYDSQTKTGTLTVEGGED